MSANDLPTVDDRLGWDAELSRFAERILACDPPYVFGIHGDWGSGKTSFMRQLQARLGGPLPDDGTVANIDDVDKAGHGDLAGQVATVWFDTWRYQNEPVPVVALLQEMRAQLKLLPSVINRAEKLGAITVRYLLDSLADVGKAIGIEGIPSAGKIDKLGEAWEQSHHEHTLHTNSIRQHLRETIAALLPEPGARVVVFIDDIDRCNPKAAMRLLEGLKIYLGITNCVFVLGMNERILVDAIREELSAPKDTPEEVLKLRAGHYLEKICTDIYRLPLPREPAAFLCLCNPLVGSAAVLQAALAGLACLPPNPRRLKSLANQWARLAAVCPPPPPTPPPTPDPLPDEARQVWAVRVLVAAYIHQFHRDLWERWHFRPDFWNEIKAWVNGERAADGAEPDAADAGPAWARGLQRTVRLTGWDEQSRANWAPLFPNPGDIEVFWIGELIRKYSDQLVPADFEPMLRLQGPGSAP